MISLPPGHSDTFWPPGGHKVTPHWKPEPRVPQRPPPVVSSAGHRDQSKIRLGEGIRERIESALWRAFDRGDDALVPLTDVAEHLSDRTEQISNSPLCPARTAVEVEHDVTVVHEFDGQTTTGIGHWYPHS